MSMGSRTGESAWWARPPFASRVACVGLFVSLVLFSFQVVCFQRWSSLVEQDQ